MPNTKIVATLGPASDSPDLLDRLLEAGVDVFRINASHASQQQTAERISAVRAAEKKHARFVGILLDLQGPKIRLGRFENGLCELCTGSAFTITVEPVLGTAERASTSYARFAKDVKPGDRILFGKYSGNEIKLLDEDYLILREDEIVGVLTHAGKAAGKQ